MTHKMKLSEKPYFRMSLHLKTIELRMHDEKRKKIQVGDEIVFTHTEDAERQIFTTVVALHYFSNFTQLYETFGQKKLIKKCGYFTSETPDPKDMEKYYSKEEQEQLGVVGIELSISHEKNHGFYYTRENVMMRLWSEKLRKNLCGGKYLLYGPSGCGKTTYINSIFYGKKVSRYTCENIKDMIYQNAKYGTPISLPQRDVVIIDFIDQIMHLEAHMMCFWDIMKQWKFNDKGQERTIICLISKKEAIAVWENDFQVHTLKETTLTPYIVRTLAEDKNMKIGENEVKTLSVCRMNEIGSILNRLEFKRELF